MALWAYADYITLDGAARLARLRLHIQECSQRLIGTTTRSNRVDAIASDYLSRLQAEEQRLAGLHSAASSSGRNLARVRNY